MATWAKIKFFWDTMLGSTGSTVTATSTETDGDYSVDYLHNWLEVNSWKSLNTVTPIYIIYDAGVGNTMAGDYLTILGHNLFSLNASVALEYSSTGLWAGEETEVLSATSPTSDNVFHREFTNSGSYRYWRLVITGTLSEAPYMTIAVWGLKTELDFVSTIFDPHGVNHKTNISMSSGGYITGVHEQYKERSISLAFSGADASLYSKVKNWHDSIGIRNFFVAWDSENSSDDVFLVRSGEVFSNPFDETGVYRDISIELKGRVE